MEIYIDSEFRCHTSAGEGLEAMETAMLDGKCQAYIEGCRFVPEGRVWERWDGERFAGEMTAPWMDHQALEAAQSMYEQSEAEHTAEIASLVEMIYQADMEVIG